MAENKEVATEEQTQTQEETAKTYSEDEVQKMIQSEADRRVTQALEKQRQKYEKKITLSALDDEAREKAEKDLQIQELTEQLKDLTVLQTKQEVIKVLNNRGLNPAFVDVINVGNSVEEAQATIEQLDKLFKDAVAAEVKQRLNSYVPAAGDSTVGLTQEKFKSLTLAQKTELYKQNPELYKQFVGVN